MLRSLHFALSLAVAAAVAVHVGPAAADEEKPYSVVNGKVDKGTFNGYRRYTDTCMRCHGPDGAGSSYAPDLAASLKTMSYEAFTEVVINGRQNVTGTQKNVMPAFGTVEDVALYIDDIYGYLKARSDGAVGVGARSASSPALPPRGSIGGKTDAIAIPSVLRDRLAGRRPCAGGAAPAAAEDANLGELVDRTAFRVCADPSNLPFSNERLEGFENKIAELMGQKLGLPVTYVWYPNALGFVRNTLRANRCDVIMGVVAADELVQNTNPYYRSTYVLAYREGEGDRFGDLSSPMMQLARIGVVAGTPPADLLVRKGLADQERSYKLMVDTRVDQPARQMIEDLAKGEIDAALLWGPIAGYWGARQQVPITLVPLTADPGSRLRLDFRISMGGRPNEAQWKHDLNTLIRDLQPQIQSILEDYGVPLLDGRGRLIKAEVEMQPPGVGSGVPEPAGYRMDQFKAPVPATLEGATVLTTATLRRLLGDEQPILVDVLPKARKPEGRDPSQLWVEPRRDDLPGSVWLPNVGFGELSPDLATYMRTELARLTGGDKGKPLVFYCDPNCWMSWNAAKRAVTELGYSRVYWYPEGAQGWQQAGQPVMAAQSVPMSEPRP